MLSDREQKVLRTLRLHIELHGAPPADRYAIGAATGLNYLQAHEAVAELQWRGFLKRLGPDCSMVILTDRGMEATAKVAAAITQERQFRRANGE